MVSTLVHWSKSANSLKFGGLEVTSENKREQRVMDLDFGSKSANILKLERFEITSENKREQRVRVSTLFKRSKIGKTGCYFLLGDSNSWQKRIKIQFWFCFQDA